MALPMKTIIQFPILAPPPSNQPHHHRPATEIHFSRWNNAKFSRHERPQKEIEDQIRFHPTTIPTPKSTRTSSTPSRPSVPGERSKYSKPPQNPGGANSSSHPAFKRIIRPRKIPNNIEEEAGIKVGDNGLSYVIPEAPFEFQYSYTETPKVKPVKLREPPVSPFGPGTMPRPWTGKKPLPPSKKKLEFDSFVLPPPHKKGVKPVQAPGPFLPGSGPKYVRSREEILGEPLSKEEIEDLIKGCLKSQRQLNIGRDGLTHNMLDNIHALWKRKRVCKIKCKGVCTVDMDNVRQQLEEKTGGKIIYSSGGVIFLFRGRNYNYKSRPVFPLMLWKPVTPVYPRLIPRAPEGLTVVEASEMRKKGRELMPICKLGKNGVYCNLVKKVREAFEACELVRINCQGMNGSDYRKIGAKLKDLVPCVLISFELEHILMWRGREWKSMFTQEDDPQGVGSDIESASSDVPSLEGQSLCPQSLSLEDPENGKKDDGLIGEQDMGSQFLISVPKIVDGCISTPTDSFLHYKNETKSPSIVSANVNTQVGTTPWTEGVVSLRRQAIQEGSAIILDDSCLDADTVYEKAVALAQSAPAEPKFRKNQPKKGATKTRVKQESGEVEEKVAVVTVSEGKGSKKRSPKTRKQDIKGNYEDIVPQRTLRVDELAKLLN